MKNSSTLVLLIGFGLILLLLLASSAIGLKNMSDINQRMETMVQNRIIKADILQTMRNFARERSMSLLRIVIKDDPFELDEEIQHFHAQAGHWIKNKEKLETFQMDVKVKGMLKVLFKNGGDVAKQQRMVISLIEQENREEAQELLLEKVIPGQNEVIKLYENILKYQQHLSKSEVDEAELAYEEAFSSLLIISSTLLFLGLAIAAFVVRQNARVENQLREDLRVQHKLQIELKSAQKNLLKAQELAKIGNWYWDVENDNLQFSEQIYRIFGINKAQWKDGYSDFFKAIHPDDKKIRKTTIANFLDNQQAQYQLEYRITRPDQSIRYLTETGQLIEDKTEHNSVIATVQDVTQRKNFEQEIEYYAYHDTLTGLPNRRLLLDRLELEIGHSGRLNNCGALLFIDVDNFKKLNDSLGHQFGDNLIKQVANRISNSVRNDDTVARIGGDEFVVILPALSEHLGEAIQKAETIGEKIRIHLAGGYILDEREFHITASIGIAIFEDAMQSPDDLLKQSDSALYVAKNAGRNAVRFYDQKMQEEADRRLAMEREIRQALFTGQFKLNYQPQINQHGEIIGVEALVRWHHPQKGVISPIEFISVAEESGLIIPMGVEILNNACAFIKILEQYKLPSSFKSVSVNISPKQFSQPDFVDIVKEKIAENKIHPSRLMLEITEGLLLQNIDEIVEKMEQLKELSVHFSIDDFGTGYSSMLYLQRLPLDELKIDQSFIHDVSHNHRNAAIVETIISMAKNLNLSLVAEGVEEQEQQQFLAQKGCDCYQGYFYEKPVSEELLIEKYFQSYGFVNG